MTGPEEGIAKPKMRQDPPVEQSSIKRRLNKAASVHPFPTFENGKSKRDDPVNLS